MRIAPPWLRDPTTLVLLDALRAAGIEARFVGGVVRDALLGRPSADIDLATPARPEDIIAALEKAGIKAVPTGITHGTVTAVVNFSGLPPRHFEITTLRRDVETDGRHALVAFDADWSEDAARRDFTINALYLDPDGTVHDPVGGLADLATHRIRFVGEPARRIAEDVLRVLRYYRFEARFGRGEGDMAARAACRDAVMLLPSLSAERVAQELLRLLAVADPVPALRMMREDGVLAAILPEAARLDRLAALIGVEPTRDAVRRLAALVDVDPDGAARLAERLRLSNAIRDRLMGLAKPWPLDPAGDRKEQRRALYRLGADRVRDLLLLLAAEGRLDRENLAEKLACAAEWEAPNFPVGGRDVMALGIPPGPRVGRLLDAVRGWWEEGDFRAGRAACHTHLRELVKQESRAASDDGALDGCDSAS
jgi:poly(A) polymerase